MKKVLLLVALVFMSMFGYAQPQRGNIEYPSGMGTIKALSRNGEYAIGTSSSNNSFIDGYSSIWSKSDNEVVTIDFEKSWLTTISNNGIVGGRIGDTNYINEISGNPMPTGGVYKNDDFKFTGYGSAGFVDIYSGSEVLGISADGNTAVGYVYSTSEVTAGIIWDITNINNITYVQGSNNSKYYTISGNIIGGTSKDALGQEVPTIWNNGAIKTFKVNRDDWEGWDFYDYGTDAGSIDMISSNGKYAVGKLKISANRGETIPKEAAEAEMLLFYDIVNDKMIAAYQEDWLPTYGSMSGPLSVSNDGGVVGTFQSYSFYWSKDTGFMTITDYLKSKGVKVGGMLSSPIGISDDGMVVAGESWIAKVGVIGSTLPANNVVDVNINAEISVAFNVGVTEGDFSNITITPSAGTVSASIVNGKLVVTSSEDLAYETKYTVTIPVGTLNEVTEEIIWSFTTIFDPANPPVATLNSNEWVMGEVLYNKTVTKDFTLTNTGASLLRVTDVTFKDNGKDVAQYFSTNIVIGDTALANGESYDFKISFTASVLSSLDEVEMDITTNTGTSKIAISGSSRATSVVSTSPTRGATNVSIYKPFTVVFQDDVTISGNASFFANDPDYEDFHELTASLDGNILTLTHERPLLKGKIYTVTLDYGNWGVKELDEAYSFSFTTTTKPGSNTFTPTNGSIEVALDAQISATFDEDVTLVDASKVTVSPAVEGMSVSLENNVLTITHDDDLTYETEYVVVIAAGAVKNANNEENNEIIWGFTTQIEVVAPVAKTLTPANESTEVAVEAGLSVEFNVDFTIADTSKIMIEPEVSGLDISVDGNVLTIVHDGLAYETEYTITIEAGAINGVNASNEEIIWTFTTEVESIKPIVQTLSPADESTEVALDADLRVEFDIDITLTTDSLITITPNVEITNASVSGKILTISHAGFAEGTIYTVKIGEGTVTGVKAVNDEITWNFITFGEDVGISGIEQLNTKVYPNPTTGLVNIEVEGVSNVRITDVTGRIIDSFTLQTNATYKFEAKGIYIMTIERNGKVATHKIIVD